MSERGIQVSDDVARRIEMIFSQKGLHLLQPRVGGDSFFSWDADGGELYIGLQDGTVCDIYFKSSRL
jgi:hypothetical protein